MGYRLDINGRGILVQIIRVEDYRLPHSFCGAKGHIHQKVFELEVL